MALIQTVEHENAEGETKEAFDTLQAMIGASIMMKTFKMDQVC